MAFTIGRAGKTLALNDPSMWAETSGGLTVTTITTVSPATDALRLRDQLLGYVDNWDEPIVPVVCDSEPRLTGYYRVTGVQIDTDPVAVGLGIFTASVSLERVAGFAQPYLESIMSGALLTNAVGAVIGDVVQFHGYPGVATEYYRGAATSTNTRASADGTINFNINGSIGSTASFGLTPANFYVGAATIKQGATLQPVVGRILAQADPTHWELSNGIVKVTPNAGNPGEIDITYWTGGAWGTAKTYYIGVAAVPGANALTGFASMTILRNSVEESIIRLSCTYSGTFGSFGRVNLDIAIRRGDRIARMYLQLDVAQQAVIGRATVEAASNVAAYGAVAAGAGGIRATVNDVDGNRYVLLSYQKATTNDLVNGRIQLNATSTTMDIGIGCELPGGAGTANVNDPVGIAKEYIAAQTESQRVVAR